MKTPILYLLRSEFIDAEIDENPYHCPQCMQVEGLLAIYPQVRQNLTVCYVDFDRPRGDMAGYVGNAQSCPQLVFPDGDDAHSVGISEGGVSSVRRVEQVEHIFSYLTKRFNLPQPHP